MKTKKPKKPRVRKPPTRPREPQLELPDPGWKQVLAPLKWNPAEGEILEGLYAGVITTDGQYGPQRKHIVRTNKGAFYPGGMQAEDLFRAALLDIGEPCRLIFTGRRMTGNGNQMNVYELFVRGDRKIVEADPLDAC